jgi:hypothetical protein
VLLSSLVLTQASVLPHENPLSIRTRIILDPWLWNQMGPVLPDVRAVLPDLVSSQVVSWKNCSRNGTTAHMSGPTGHRYYRLWNRYYRLQAVVPLQQPVLLVDGFQVYIGRVGRGTPQCLIIPHALHSNLRRHRRS